MLSLGYDDFEAASLAKPLLLSDAKALGRRKSAHRTAISRLRRDTMSEAKALALLWK